MTNAQILAYVRGMLHDRVPPYRYENDQLYLALSSALAAAHRFRPDLFFGTSASALPVYTPADAAEIPPIDPAWHFALGDYVVALMQISEEETAHMERAGALLGHFARVLGATT